eukprot:4177983-Prymnesium_polylepis.1
MLSHDDAFPPLGASLRGSLPTRHRGGRPGVQPPTGARDPERFPSASKIFTPAAATTAAHDPAL